MSIFTVTNTNNSGLGSLRQQILNADLAGGTNIINFGGLFSDGLAHTINLNGSSLSITDDLTIQGTNASLLTIKDDSPDRVFDIGKGATSAINRLTITNTYDGANGGGAISNEGILTLNNSIITGNTVSNNIPRNFYGLLVGVGGQGGGIYNTGSLTVNHSSITDNTALHGVAVAGGLVSIADSGSGGGIYNTGSLTVNHSSITDNTAVETTNSLHQAGGGGIFNIGSLTVNHSTITDNRADDGGGIYNNGSLNVNYSAVTDNRADYDGGGIYNIGSLNVNYSAVTDNRADYDGGGIYIGSFGSYLSSKLLIATMSYSTISANQAGDDGGGISFQSSSYLVVDNSTITSNKAYRDGGGIYQFGFNQHTEYNSREYNSRIYNNSPDNVVVRIFPIVLQ
ncbi:MAG: hypothetical protein ACYTXA_02190 [Nostoc sp.]